MRAAACHLPEASLQERRVKAYTWLVIVASLTVLYSFARGHYQVCVQIKVVYLDVYEYTLLAK